MGMFDRFTDRARKVMALANQQAERFKHQHVGTEHILLGLLKEASGVGATILRNLGVNMKELQSEVEKLHPSETLITVTTGKLPYTPQAKMVIEYAIEEAKQLNHNYAGTEHILLGIVRAREATAAEALMNLGLKLEDVRHAVLELLGVEELRPSESTVPLTLLIDPGDATAEELSALFVELSTLYRMIGGSGVDFTIVDAKEPAVA